MTRRRHDHTKDIAKLIVLAAILIGFAVVHYAKLIVSIGIAIVAAGLVVLCLFGLYFLGKKVWRNQLNSLAAGH